MPVYRDPGYGEPSWMRVVRALSASFRMGRFFRVELRVFYLTLVLLPVFFAIELARTGRGFAEVLTLTVLASLALYVVVYVHEMSHILAARRYGIHTPLITLSPLGGVAHLGTPAPNPRAELWIALAGPAVHLPFLAVFWPLSVLLDPSWGRPESWTSSPLYYTVDFLRQINLWLMVFNLLPVFPLDGGRVLRALLTMKLDAGRATRIACRVGQVGAVAFVVLGLFREAPWGGILVVIGISVFLSCMQELRALRYAMGPYDSVASEPWESDAEAWKGGGHVPDAVEPKGETPRRQKREARRARKAQEADAALDEAVDQVLDRVNEVGLEGLTRAERAILDRASKARRGS